MTALPPRGDELPGTERSTRRRADDQRLFLMAAALDAIADAVVITEATPLDEPGPRIIYVNRAFVDMTGYAREEAVGRSPRFLWGPKTDPAELADLRAAMEKKSPYRSELLHYSKDGSEYWADVQYQPLINEQGVQSHWLAIRRDVTERRRELAILRERQEMFKILFESNPLPMLIFDQVTFQIIEVNRAAMTDYGWTRDEFLAKTMLDLRRHVYHQAALRSLNNRSYPSRRTGPWRVLRADGSEIDVMVFASDIDYFQRPAVLRAAWDVTEMEQARTELVEREDRLRVTAATLQERTLELTDAHRLARLAIWRVDLTTDQVTWSDELFAMFGLVPGSFIPDRGSFLSLVHPDDRAATQAAVNAMTASKTGYTAEFRIRTASGKISHIVAQGRCVLGTDGEINSVLGLCQDITDRKLAEQAVLRSAKLSMIGQLTGGVAHDFNNLLTVVSLTVESVADQLAENDPRRPPLQAALDAAARGAELNSQLLSFARRQALRPTVLDIGTFLEPMQKMAERVLGARYGVLYRRPAGTAMTRIDPAHLESAILNLVINARDAMPGGGGIAFDVANVHFDEPYAMSHDEMAAGDYVMIAVSDAGTGMTPEVISRAFEPFFSTKPTGQGTGLGLSMVLGFARQSGGYVNIYSEVGSGTTVRLYLPAYQVDAAPPAAPAAVAATWLPGPLRTLLVDDQAPVLAAVTRLCESVGLDVITASSTGQALELLRSDPAIELLFTDIVLPGPLSGFALAQQAVRIIPGLKVLYTSGYAETALMHHGRLEPGVELLVKPYRRTDLVNALRRLFEPAPP